MVYALISSISLIKFAKKGIESFPNTIAGDIQHLYVPFIGPMLFIMIGMFLISYFCLSAISVLITVLSLGTIVVDTRIISTYVSTILSFLPVAEMVIARYIMREEINKIFFHALEKKDRALHDFLINQRQHGVFQTFLHMLLRYLSMIPVWCLILFLSHLPIIGRLIVPILNFYALYKVFGIISTLSLSFIIFLIPSMHPMVFFILQYLHLSLYLGTDLLLPFLSRKVPLGKEIKFIATHKVLITGFCLPYLLLSFLPFIGPWMFLFAQAAAADLLIEMKMNTPVEDINRHGSIWNYETKSD